MLLEVNLHPVGPEKHPLVVSNTEKTFASFNTLFISSKVCMLQTGQPMYLFKSVGSRHILKDPLGFFTRTKDFNQGVVVFLYSLEIIPRFSMQSSSSLNLSCVLKGHASMVSELRLHLLLVHFAGSAGSLPIPVNIDLNL